MPDNHGVLLLSAVSDKRHIVGVLVVRRMAVDRTWIQNVSAGSNRPERR
jgi:hypothetical protein